MSLCVHADQGLEFLELVGNHEHLYDRYSTQFENNYFKEMCSGSEAGSYLRLIDSVYHTTLGLRAIKKKRSHADDQGRESLQLVSDHEHLYDRYSCQFENNYFTELCRGSEAGSY